MKLTDLNPRFVDAGGEGITETKTGKPVPLRKGAGLSFDCPCGCGEGCFVSFKTPIGGGKSHGRGPFWERTGETFETLTLRPSILRVPEKGGCGWHGYITDGEAVSV